MGGEGGTSDLAEAGEDVDDARWETGFFDKICGEEGTEWCLLSGLEDDGITTCDGGADLPCPHEEREIPGDDLGADADLCGRQFQSDYESESEVRTGSCLVYEKVSVLVSMTLPSILSAHPP